MSDLKYRIRGFRPDTGWETLGQAHTLGTANILAATIRGERPSHDDKLVRHMPDFKVVRVVTNKERM